MSSNVVGITLLWAISVGSGKLCCNDRMGLGVRNVGIITPNRGTTRYTKSLVNTNLVNTNFTNTHFQKVPIPHLTRIMKQKFLH